MLQALETKLDEVLNKKAPYKMPDGARKGFAGALWWLALLFGVLQLWFAWSLWDLTKYVRSVHDAVNTFYGYDAINYDLNFFYYLALIVVVVDAVLLLMAAPKLKAFKKFGWNLLFYSMLLNLAYGLVLLFSNAGGGFGSFVWAVISSAAVAYLLFQVRDLFKGVVPSKPSVTSPKTSK